MQLCQVGQLFQERDNLFFGGWLSHRRIFVALIRSSGSLGRPLLELVDELGESVSIIESVRLHGFFEPLSVPS